jgi:hypothetical protein
MNDLYVEKLFYQVVIPKGVDYDKSPPFSGEADDFRLHLSKDQLKTSPEVEMIYLRYKLYREGRESLLGMAYWCLTVVEYSARGRTEAADQYRVDLKVLRRLGELCGNRGGINEARKLSGQAGVTPLKPEEREWIKTVIKTLILRVGEYAFNPIAKLTQITMSDFPSTT